MSSSIQSSLPAPALQASKAALNAALSDLESSEPGEVQDTDEVAAVRWVDMATLWSAVSDGTVNCGISLAALMRAQLAAILPAQTR